MIGLLLAVFPKRWRKSVARSQRRDTSLRLEWLEDRVTPAQFVNGVWTGAVSTD
jgi:hypothetical protein